METVTKLANIWANYRGVEDGVVYYRFSDRALDVFTQKVIQECIWAFGETRTEPSLEKYILDRMEVTHAERSEVL